MEDIDVGGKLSPVPEIPSKVIDVVPYNGEPIILFRLKYLWDVVDEFVIVEAQETHSGKPKAELYFDAMRAEFEPYMSKITYLVITSFPPVPTAWLESVPPRFAWMQKGAHESWWREMYQREFGERYLREQYIESNVPFIAVVADCDEIPKRDALIFAAAHADKFGESPVALEMDFHYYSWRWRKVYKWASAFIVNDRWLAARPRPAEDAKTSGEMSPFNAARTGTDRYRVLPMAGWHCSYFFSKDGLRRKLESFAHRECDQSTFKTDAFLNSCIQGGKDIVGRGGTEDCLPTTDFSSLPEGWEQFQKVLEDSQA